MQLKTLIEERSATLQKNDDRAQAQMTQMLQKLTKKRAIDRQ